MSRTPTAILGALPAAAAVLLTACGSVSSGADSITVYSGQHEQTTAALVAVFERQTGIKVNVRSGDEAALGNQVLQEGTSSPADVFYSENTPVLESLREHHLLAFVAPATTAQTPSRYNSPQGYWVGVSARVSALVYNTSALTPAALPESVLELSQPRWKGRLGFAPSETDFQPLIAAIAKAYGEPAAERWLKGMQSNATAYPDNETVVTQVNNGQSELAPIDHYYWYRMREELGSGGVHSALHYYAPHDVGALVSVSGAAVLASSAHRAAAQRFVAFLVSRLGQETLAHSHSYEYPLRPGVRPAPGLPPLSQVAPAPLAPAELGDGSAVLALEQKLGLF